MPISREQPMRPYLDDIGDAIESLDARVTALEQGGGGGGRGFTIAQADAEVPTVDNMTSDASGEVNE